MEMLYQVTVYVSLTLLAIVIAVFVFASSIQGGALKKAAEEEESLLSKRRQRIEQGKESLVSKMNSLHSSRFVEELEELKAEISQLDNDLKNIDQSVSEARRKGKAMSLNNMVVIPSIFLLASIILSAISIPTSGTLPIVTWSIALIMLFTALYFIYRNLRIVEIFSGVTDLSTQVREALETDRAEMQLVASVEVEEDMQKDIQEDVAAALASLTATESRMLHMLFGIGCPPMSTRQIGREFGLAERVVHAQLTIALRKLRHPSRSKRLKKYLDNLPIMGSESGEQQLIMAIFGFDSPGWGGS